jgi:hypothetical protein
MSNPNPRDVFIIRRHEINGERAAELANGAGYQFFALNGLVYDARDPGVSVCCFADIMEDRSSMKLEPDPLMFSSAVDDVAPSIVVLDGLYVDPVKAASIAAESDFAEHPERHKGLRSNDFPIPEMFRQLFETVTGRVGGGHSCFQLNFAGDQLVFHSDAQRWAAAIYLSDKPPISAGTSFWRRRTTLVRSSADLRTFAGKDGWPSEGELEVLTYGGALLDRTAWEEVDRVGNVFNRLVIWDSRLIHSVSDCFGHDRETGRLVQLFFWNPA